MAMTTNTDPSSKRKPFNNLAGYIASRHNDINGGWVVIYDAAEAGLDASGGRYVVSCEKHNVLVNVTSMKLARPCLKVPDFCEECMKDNANN
jgi:hypothetical protein